MLNICSPACDCCHPPLPLAVRPSVSNDHETTQGICVTCGDPTLCRCAQCGHWLHDACRQVTGCSWCMAHPTAGRNRHAGRVGLDLVEAVLADESRNPELMTDAVGRVW